MMTARFEEKRESIERAQRVTTGVALAIWAGLIVVAHVLLERLARAGVNVKLKAPPLFGVFEDRSGWRVGLPVAIAAAVVVIGAAASRRLRWRALLLVVPMASATWAVSLALIDGWAGLSTALSSHTTTSATSHASAIRGSSCRRSWTRSPPFRSTFARTRPGWC